MDFDGIVPQPTFSGRAPIKQSIQASYDSSFDLCHGHMLLWDDNTLYIRRAYPNCVLRAPHPISKTTFVRAICMIGSFSASRANLDVYAIAKETSLQDRKILRTCD